MLDGGPEPLDADRIIMEACEMMAPLVSERGLELTTRPLRQEQVIRADRERILQVFSNLVGNAIRFTPEGGSITVGAERHADEVAFFVEDTGPGIAPENLERVFEPLFSTKSFGTGLGLPTVKQIVEQHGGSIRIESQVGQGTRVLIRLPLTQSEETAA